MWRDALKSRKIHVLLAVAALYFTWQVWLTVAAPGKITGFPTGEERVNILVMLPFPPERFHIQLFQSYGRVSGTQENAVEIRRVKRADLSALARHYWVKRIEPLPPEG
jgi:hypothetical protein